MTRRIVLTVLALITVLLAITGVPLGLITASQDRRDFQDETRDAAKTLSNVAEEQLADHARGPALTRSVTELARAGDLVAVYNSAGRLVTSTPVRPTVPAGRIRLALAGTPTRLYPATDRLVAVASVSSDGGSVVGAVALSRPAEVLDHRIDVIWGWLALVAAGGLLAAALIGTALARWVSRPLAALGTAARQLGDGALDTRAAAGQGPGEVRQLAANFNTMAARLQAHVHGHRAMMADVSHQLRTPLAALRLRLDVLAQDGGDAMAEELAGAQEEIARLGRMVNGLLAVARAENVTTQPVQVAVDAVLCDRVAAWRPAAEEREVTLSTAGLQPAAARLGEGHLEQIIDNLLANALDAVPSGGTVRVAAQPAGNWTTITVADDGPGMTQQQQRTAFRRFASSTSGGTGLGLAIVDRLATSSGGSAALSDTPGGGLTVTIDLPAAAREHVGGGRGRQRPDPR